MVWDETLNNGAWTSDGCHLTNLLNNLIVFHCNRLGYYGLLQEVSHMDGNRYEAFLYVYWVFFLIVILLLLSVIFAVYMERNLDTRIPQYILEVL